MKPESSKKTDVYSRIKAFSKDAEPFVRRRHIVWPKALFIEFNLSEKQARKVARWVKAGHSVVPMWNVNCRYVLFIDQEAFEDWIREKGTS